jgi:STAS domain-containing protein
VDELFSLATDARGGVVIVAVRGDVDEFSAPGLDSTIAANHRRLPMVIDLTEVELITSAGIAALLRARLFPVFFACPPSHPAKLLAIVDPDQRIQIFDDLDTAIEHATNTHAGTSSARQYAAS